MKELKDIQKTVDKYNKELDLNWKVEDYTCTECLDNDTCEYSFDPYNVLGDCMAEK